MTQYTLALQFQEEAVLLPSLQPENHVSLSAYNP